MELGKAFTYVFEDEKWVEKIFIGGLFLLISFLIIPIFFVIGYQVEIIERILEGKEKPLPQWTNLGEKLSKGFSLIVTVFIYQLPIFIIYIFLFIPMIFLFLLPSIGKNSETAAGIIAIIFMLIFFLVMIIVFAYSIFVFLITPAVTTRYALTKSIREGLNIKEVWQFTKSNIGNVLIVLLLAYAASLIGAIGVIAFFIGFAFTSFYSLTVTGYLYGELAKAGGLSIKNEHT